MWPKARKSTGVVYPEEVVREHASRHLAEVFGLPAASLANDARFGRELQAAPASDFKPNEFDIIDGDIRDVADKRLLKEMAQGRLVIHTVGDYREHMVRWNRINPDAVARLLRPAAQN